MDLIQPVRRLGERAICSSIRAVSSASPEGELVGPFQHHLGQERVVVVEPIRVHVGG
jgi:hypothetical protein